MFYNFCLNVFFLIIHAFRVQKSTFIYYFTVSLNLQSPFNCQFLQSSVLIFCVYLNIKIYLSYILANYFLFGITLMLKINTQFQTNVNLVKVVLYFDLISRLINLFQEYQIKVFWSLSKIFIQVFLLTYNMTGCLVDLIIWIFNKYFYW